MRCLSRMSGKLQVRFLGGGAVATSPCYPAMNRKLRERRQRRMTQAQLAKELQSSQSRIAKAETGDKSVSIELLVRAMLATGATPKEDW